MTVNKTNEQKRFKIVLEESSGKVGFVVFQDTETDINYLYVSSEEGGGVTALINQYGNPLV